MKKTFSLVIALSIMVQVCALPIPAHALSYDPNNIIGNEDFFNANSMSLSDIQNFLEKKRSSLAVYIAQAADGTTKRASEIIYEAAKKNGISPKVLLVLLQKEQSLIENPAPTQYNYDWATGFARCDSCSADDPRITVYKGFGNQVEKAAWRKHYYVTNPFEFNFRAGETRVVDGMSVTPANSATAALYNYTPHLRGNFSFWKLWARYFGKTLPDGLVVQIRGGKKIWLIQQGQKREFASPSAFLSRYASAQVLTVSQQDLDTYPDGAVIRFPQYSLLQSPKGAVFLLVDDKKFGITSGKIFKTLGFNRDEVMKATAKELDAIPTGGYITNADTNPMGELMQDQKTGGVYYVKQGIKYPILDRAVLANNFPYRKIARVSQKKLDALPKGDPIKLTDGTLATLNDTTTIYVISNGEKRAIASREAFESLGFNKENIQRVSEATLALHPEGSPIDLGKDVSSETPPPVLVSTSSMK